MKRKIDSESLPLKNWKKEATMFQDDYTAGAGTSWLLNVAKAENKMIWEMIRAIEEAPTLTPPNEPLTCEELREMDGEAIYWPKNKMWLIVYLNHPDFGDCAVNREGQYLQLEKCEKQKVYRRQPEGEEDT